MMFIRILYLFLATLVYSDVTAYDEKKSEDSEIENIYDITQEISSTSPCVSSANAPIIEDVEANGPLYNEICYPHIINTVSYAGTCIAAPSLFDGNWKNINNIPLNDLVMVNCVVVDLSKILNGGDNVQISAEDIKEYERNNEIIPEKSFVIIYTGWSKHWGDDNRKYVKNFPIISKDAADYLIEREIIGLGIDGPTIDKKSDGFPIQDLLFSRGMFLIKNLSNQLERVKCYYGKAIIAPLKFENSNEAPVRVYFITQSKQSFFKNIINKVKGWFGRD